MVLILEVSWQRINAGEFSGFRSVRKSESIDLRNRVPHRLANVTGFLRDSDVVEALVTLWGSVSLYGFGIIKGLEGLG